MKLSPVAMEAARAAGLFPAEPPDVIELVLPWPPSVNAYWRSFVPKGWTRATVHVSEDGKRYQEAVRCLAEDLRIEPLRGHLKLEVTFHPPDNRGHDLDNRLKPMIDALANAGAFENDVQIREIHAKFGPVAKGGKAVVRVSTLLELVNPKGGV